MFRGMLLTAAALLVGCSSKPLDYCTLLTLNDVAQVHDEVVTKKMEEWYPNTDHVTSYCSWKDDKDKNVLSLSVSLATTNSPQAIASVFSGGAKVTSVSDVGTDAAVFFYPRQDAPGEAATFFARNRWWSLDIRAPIDGGVSGPQFAALKSAANAVFANLHKDKTFSRLEK